MKASDVAARLLNEVHKYTDLLSDVFDIVALSNAAGVCMVQTSQPHGLMLNKPFFITGIDLPLAITSFTRAGTVGTIVTSADHDLTIPIAPKVTVIEADVNGFNGEFVVTDIPNRRTIKVVMQDTGPTSASNSKLMSALRYDQRISGIYKVLTVESPTVITFATDLNMTASATSGKLKTNLRVTAAATMERAVAAFTAQPTNKNFAYVILGDSRASQTKTARTDSIAEIGRGNEYYQQVIESVAIYVIGNASDEIAARAARDRMVDLLVAITKSLAFYRFPSSFYIGVSRPLVFVSHGGLSYDGVLYVHQFIFECLSEMTYKDTVGHDVDVAFREIDMSMFPDLDGTGHMDSIINLDTEAL